MSVILALDTSTEACSCALNVHGEVHEDFAIIPRQHAQSILPMVHKILQQQRLNFSDLDAIAFGRGPGSFTGLRIAAGVTQGMAFAADLPVIPVSTLAALALQAHELLGSRRILACIDARIDEIYWAAYEFEQEHPELLGEEYLCKPELMNTGLLENFTETFTLVGNGLNYQARFPGPLARLTGSLLPDELPRAGAIAKLAARAFAHGLTIPPEEAAPLYLRDKVTHQ